MKLKLWEKWKKSFSLKNRNQYRYQITTTKENFLEQKYYGNNIIYYDKEIVFYLNHLPNNLKKDEQCVIVDIYRNKVKRFLQTKYLFIIAMILIILAFVSSNFLIREIIFLDDTLYNHEVYQDVEKYIKTIGPFCYLRGNINDISKELREKYNYYAYIGVIKKGAKLMIEIERQDEYQIIEDDTRIGDLVAKKEGKIVGIEVERGIVLVNTSQIVQKGDILVSSNLLYHTNPNDQNHRVSAKGKIYASTIEYQKITIPCDLNYEYYSGNANSYFVIDWFGKERTLEHKTYSNSYLKSKNFLEINKFLLIRRVTEYEKMEQQLHNSLEEGEELARGMVARDFENKRVSAFEKIDYIQLVDRYQEGEQFHYCFMVKTIENIALKKEA